MAVSGDSTAVKALKLPAFDGKEESYQVWVIRFHAYARVFGFDAALKANGEAELPATESTTVSPTGVTDAPKRAAIKRNSIAIANLTMAFSTNEAMTMIYDAGTPEWPSGLAWKIMESMKKKFAPDDTISKVELRRQLNKISMKKNDDPATLFEQLSVVRNKYNSPSSTAQLSKEELIAVIIDAAHEDYQSVLTAEQRRLGTSIELADLQSVMNQQWRALQGSNSGEDEDGEELNLSAFNGVCFKCGKKGHKANECRSNIKRTGGKFNGKCHHCGKKGHMAKDCWQKEENAHKRPKGYKVPGSETGLSSGDGLQIEYLLTGQDGFEDGEVGNITFPTSHKMLADPNVWIADTGATTHSTPHQQGMSACRKGNEKDSITVGNGKSVEASKVGNLKGDLCNKSGEVVQRKVMLRDVTHVPGAKFNLFSITRMQNMGWQLHGDKHAIWITKGGNQVKFDIKIPTPKGCIFAMYLERATEVAGAAAEMQQRMSIEEAHYKFGHANKEATREAAKALGIEIKKGKMPPCEACTLAKARQKNVLKKSEQQELKAGERRVYLDLSKVKEPKGSPALGKSNWRIIVDQKANFKHSEFFATKDAMIEPTCVLFNKWKEEGNPVTHLRLDNAGENKKLVERMRSSDWKMKLKVEFTPRNSPQYNHLAELGFATLYNKGRALMIKANIPVKMRYKFYGEAFKTATMLDGLMVVKVGEVWATRYKHCTGSNPRFAKHLRLWGEAGTVTVKSKATPKVDDRGVACMFVGYAPEHPGDTYRMWNPKTDRVIVSRDVIWLKRMFFPAKKTVPEIRVNEEEEEVVGEIESDEVERDEMEAENVDQESAQEEEAPPDPEEVPADDHPEVEEAAEPVGWVDGGNLAYITTRAGRAVRARAFLSDEQAAERGAVAGDLALSVAEREYFSTMERIAALQEVNGEIAAVGAALGGGFTHTTELKPMKYKEAMASKDRASWIEAMEVEHQKMMKMKVWKRIKKDLVPKGAKILSTTWAMKKKSNGVFRARINARGYEQVDGEHYESHDIAAPVSNERSIRVVLTLMIMAAWYGSLMDVIGAFLNGEFEDGERVYIEVPQGFEKYYDPVTEVLLLGRTLYGLKQSAKQFWRTLLMCFKSMNVLRSKVDPCLYYKWEPEGLVIWLSWVDDCLVVGPKPAVMRARDEFMARFDCDDLGEVTEYVGCKLERNMEEGWLKLTQPVLMKSYEDEFDLPTDGPDPTTPAEGGQVLRPCEEGDGLPPEMQTKYRSGVGKLLHMMRWSRPDVLNAVREQSKYMQEASPAHMKAMKRIMRYLTLTSNRGLCLNPKRKWDGNPEFEFRIYGLSDASYATDLDGRKSVSGESVFLEGSPVCMRSSQQKSVTLSTAEAELVAATSCAQEMLFVMRLMESVGLKVKKPMELFVDNKGAVDLANNWSIGGRTRHMEVRQYFLRDLKDEGLILTKWMSGDDMSSDLFTKNLPGPLFAKHAKVYCKD